MDENVYLRDSISAPAIRMKYFYPEEYKPLFRLGLPVVVAQIGLTLQNVSDNVMVGQHATEELAAAGFVNNLFVFVMLLNQGFSMGALSQMGALYAQGNRSRIMSVLKSSLCADMLQCLLLVGALIGLYFALPWLGQPEQLIPLMQPYLLIQAASLPLMALASCLKQMTDSINDTKITMYAMLAGNAWNILFNYLLIFGHCGFPEMGIIGAAWATFSSRLLILLIVLVTMFGTKRYHLYTMHWKEARASLSEMKRLNRLGWPIAIQMGLECASFSLVAIFLGWIGTNALAAHQVMNNVACIIYMIYIGIGTAVSIRVSNHNGTGNMTGVRHATWAGLQMILLVGLVLTTLLTWNVYDISLLFTPNLEVAAMVSMMVWPMVFYQLGDSTQTVLANALRGLGDVRCLIPYATIAYIVISIPLSYIFGISMELGAFGIWLAFPFGLSTAAILYWHRFAKVTKPGK